MTTETQDMLARGALRRLILLGLFAGTGTGAGFLLVGLPNIELVTLVSALAGVVLGRAGGGLAGALAAAAFSLGNPVGKPPPLLLAAQAGGMAMAGWLGGGVGGAVAGLRRAGRRTAAALLAGGTGLLATLLYDAATNVAGAAAFAVDWRVALAGAVPFTLVHAGVNVVLFALFLPSLSARYGHLARSPLRGSGETAKLALLVVALGVSAPVQAAPVATERSEADSAAVQARPVAADSTGVAETAAPDQRPWEPFDANLVAWLSRCTKWRPVEDGGYGARMVARHEADTAPWPLVLRNGAPIGTGHRWADEPWLSPITGQEATIGGYGVDLWGGAAGVVELTAADRVPSAPLAAFRFHKGDHETYLRSASFRTPRAPWRLRFDFEETLDRQGYDFLRDGDPRFVMPAAGSAAFRSGRGTLERAWNRGALTLAFEAVRKHRTGLASADVDHEEVWADRADLCWHGRTGLGDLRAVLFFGGTDVVRERSRLAAAALRKVESAREGALAEFASRDGERRVTICATGWRVDDTGATEDEAPGCSGPRSAVGEDVSLRAGLETSRGGMIWAPAVAAWWDGRGEWRPGADVKVRAPGARPWWEVSFEMGGRAPRPDELATPDVAAGGPLPDGQAPTLWLLLPNPELRRERLLRLAGRVARSVAGTEFALDASGRSLRRGIGWQSSGDAAGATGRWDNALELDAWAVTASVTFHQNLFGLLRARAEATRRGCDVRAGVPLGLPPERSASLSVDWEHDAFHGDGVFELGYRLESCGVYDDPWVPGVDFELPARTLHHLLLGFRLLGADLSLGLLNLADDVAPVAAGTLAEGRQLRLRLEWTLLR